MTLPRNAAVLTATLSFAVLPAVPASAQGYDGDYNYRYDDDSFSDGRYRYNESFQRDGNPGPRRAALERLGNAERRVRATWLADSNYIEAQKALDKQQLALDEERERVLAAAMDADPDYREAVQQVEKIEGQLEQMPEPTTQPDPSGELPPVDPQRIRLAQEKLQLQEQIAKTERRLIGDDEVAAKALAAVEDSQTQLAKLQAELDKLLLTDPEFKQAQDALATAAENSGTRW